MRFLHLAPGYAPYAGGMCKAAQVAAEGLAARGHEVTVGFPISHLPIRSSLRAEAKRSQHDIDCFPLHSAKLNFEGQIVEASAPPRNDAFHLPTLTLSPFFCWPRTSLAGWPWGFAKIWKQEWDGVLLHMPFFGMQEWLAMVGFFLRRPKRFVIWYHMDIGAKGWVGKVAQVARRTSMRWLWRRADTILVASDSYAKSSWLSDDDSLNEKIVIQPFGVDTERFTPAPTPETYPKRIVFVGGLDAPHYFKGVPVLLRACSRMVHRDDWVLDIVGDGSLRKSFETLAVRLGLEKRVRFLGKVPTGLEQVYRGAWVHVLPSTDRSEAFGIVSLEAGASGVPSVVSDLPGMCDAIVPEQTGWCVAVGDVDAWARQLETALDLSMEDRLAIGRAAREWVIRAASVEAYVGAIEQRLLSEP